MAESSAESNKFQWKWVGITFVSYIVFYLLPISIADGTFSGSVMTRVGALFIGVWLFGGIIIIAAVAGYLSKGVTLWEPAVAGLGLVVLVFAFIAIQIFLVQVGHRFSFFQAIVPLLIMMLIVFLLSLLGAWLGERAQKVWKTKPPAT